MAQAAPTPAPAPAPAPAEQPNVLTTDAIDPNTMPVIADAGDEMDAASSAAPQGASQHDNESYADVDWRPTRYLDDEESVSTAPASKQAADEDWLSSEGTVSDNDVEGDLDPAVLSADMITSPLRNYPRRRGSATPE